MPFAFPRPPAIIIFAIDGDCLPAREKLTKSVDLELKTPVQYRYSVYVPVCVKYEVLVINIRAQRSVHILAVPRAVGVVAAALGASVVATQRALTTLVATQRALTPPRAGAAAHYGVAVLVARLAERVRHDRGAEGEGHGGGVDDAHDAAVAGRLDDARERPVVPVVLIQLDDLPHERVLIRDVRKTESHFLHGSAC